MRTRLLLFGAVVGWLATISCSSGPEPPKPGTPEFIWNAAKSTYHSGDFVKTSENLQQLIKGDSEFAGRARPWAIVISAGLAQGFTETADTYEAGARLNKANPMPFRKEASQLRSLASAASVEFAESVHIFLEKEKAPNVTLAFDQPNGGAGEPPSLRKVSGGAWIQDSERDLYLKAMLQRAVLMSAARAAGSADDTAKSLELLKNSDAQRPRAEFLFIAAKALYDQSAFFGSTKLDQPNRLRLMCQEATDALPAVPETKETKALGAKIQAALKKLKTST
jgi:hypothetical protein